MSQPELTLEINPDEKYIHIDISATWDEGIHGGSGSIAVSTHEDFKKACLIAAAKLRKLADEAERLAEES